MQATITRAVKAVKDYEVITAKTMKIAEDQKRFLHAAQTTHYIVEQLCLGKWPKDNGGK